MAMIEKISVKNFKNHAHTEIELGRVTALVGPNGCGKSVVTNKFVTTRGSRYCIRIVTVLEV